MIARIPFRPVVEDFNDDWRVYATNRDGLSFLLRV